MRRPRKRVLLLTVILFALWQLFTHLSANYSCQKAAIDDLCDAWRNGDVEGDWCFHLCEAQKSCHGVTHFGKQLVVRLTGPFGKAVVKGRYARLQDSANPELELNPTNPAKDFEQRVAAQISDFYNAEHNDPVINERVASFASSDIQRKHFLQLMHQREFIWSFLFGHSQRGSPFPQLRGTCGHLFIVEESDDQFKIVSHWHTRDKLKALIKVIDLIMALEEQNVQVCDFKWEHFGLMYNQTSSVQENDKTFVIKLLDLDAVFTEKSLKLTLENYDCKTDEECDFFDCKGHCIKGDGVRKSICESSTTDSNIKRFLNMVSTSFFPPQRSLFSGVDDLELLDYVKHCQSFTCDLSRLRQLLLKTVSKLDSS